MEAATDLSTLFVSAATLLFASFTSLFSVVNPMAATPVFLSLTGDYTLAERNRIAKRACVYMFGVLTTFLLVGTYILVFFGIELTGIRIAGGIVIMRTALSMLNPEKAGRKLSKEDEQEALEREDITFSPLAMPLLSGPGSIAVVIGLASQANNPLDYLLTGVSILAVSFTTYLLLRIAPVLARFLGRTGLGVMTRMMGFIALAISVQFILGGVARFFGLT